MNTYQEKHLGAHAAAGASAGVIAGIIMGMVAMIRATAMGMSFWLPMQQIAALFFGVDSLLGGFWPTVIGMMTHLIVSGALGAIVGVFIARMSTGGAFWAGLAAGIVIWAVMTYAVLPWANSTMSERVALMPGWWFGYHLVYGSMLFLIPVFDRRIERRVAAHPAAAPSAHHHA